MYYLFYCGISCPISLIFSVLTSFSFGHSLPGVHQATARGGAEAIRDLAAAITAGTSPASGNKHMLYPSMATPSCVCMTGSVCHSCHSHDILHDICMFL